MTTPTDPLREAIIAALKAHHRYFDGRTEQQMLEAPESVLEDLLREAGRRAAQPSEQRLRDLANIADQLMHCATAIADNLQPHERWDISMDDAGPGIHPDTVPVIKAWADGAAVQSRYRGAPGMRPDQWRDCCRPGEQCIPNWMHPFMEYRVKPALPVRIAGDQEAPIA